LAKVFITTQVSGDTAFGTDSFRYGLLRTYVGRGAFEDRVVAKLVPYLEQLQRIAALRGRYQVRCSLTINGA
jgi:hypothetical protein